MPPLIGCLQLTLQTLQAFIDFNNLRSVVSGIKLRRIYFGEQLLFFCLQNFYFAWQFFPPPRFFKGKFSSTRRRSFLSALLILRSGGKLLTYHSALPQPVIIASDIFLQEAFALQNNCGSDHIVKKCPVVAYHQNRAT